MEQKTFELIRDLSNAFGPSGFEDEVVKTARTFIEGSVDHMDEDPIRNLFLYREAKDPSDDRPVLMLDAHSDEVGYMIQSIRDNGTMEMITIGSQLPANIPATKVWILAEDGNLVTGVVSSKPPHFTSAAERNKPLDITELVIDIGAVSRKEVEEVFHIGPGCPAVPAVEFEYNEKNQVALGKGFDDRIGCAVVLEVLRRLAGKKLGTRVVGTLTSQEEVGERGCIAALEKVRPQIAICIEGAPADDTFSPAYNIQNGLHRGPMLRYMDVCMITHPRFIRYAFAVADELGIPTQKAVRRGGGTNGGAIQNQTGTVPCIVISCPVRYTHSHQTFTALDDFEKTVELVCGILERLDGKVLASF
ncbi:MAG: M20/M25/M40 family metallo-hydrolase [Firmicutes bacterium]|nr:M20/M25/M40 family metallo-hydrolase [Bacillota bacterium]